MVKKLFKYFTKMILKEKPSRAQDLQNNKEKR